MGQLKVYKASAGSGKTYKITEEFLRLLFADPENYRLILAVTFTNKAAEEMKNRIIQELYNLSNKKPGSYLNLISKEFGLSAEQVYTNASFILAKILHNYSRFSVGTIDSFFQGVLIAFARELGLQTNFNLELDNNYVLGQVADDLFVEIEKDNALLNWMVRFAEDKIEQAKSWELKQDILNLGAEIFKEDFKSFDKGLLEKLMNKELLTSYYSDILKIKSAFEARLKKVGLDGIDCIQQSGFQTKDFFQGERGPAGHFKKIAKKNDYKPNSYTLEAFNHVEKWVGKNSDKKNELQNMVESKLAPFLNDAITYYYEKSQDYYSSITILSNFYTLGILSDLAEKIKEYATEKNIFLISDTGKLLNRLIDDNDAPFIYEKTGNNFDFFMIDEFQDTSRLQWENFKPLILNSLSTNNANLIVGDIKQSIYRWRNGDWKILASALQQEFNQHLQTENLTYNWRSASHIIRFNNSLFLNAANILQNKFNAEISEHTGIEINASANDLTNAIEGAYTGLLQQIPENKANSIGYTDIRFFADNDEHTWQEQALENLSGAIDKLLALNYDYKDIAILVRTKQEGKTITEYLLGLNQDRSKNNVMHRLYEVISDESVFLNQSFAIRILVAALQYIKSDEGPINKALLYHEYCKYHLQNKKIEEIHLFDSYELNKNNFLSHLPEAFFLNEKILKQMPVYELVEELIMIFGLNKSKTELPYIQTFQDELLNLSKKSPVDIAIFLNWWDENGHKITVSVSENQDAIRIMTIHKAKGLQFQAVIVPFCNWKIDHDPLKNVTLWCKPGKAPFNQIDLIPVKYSSNLKETIFQDDYFMEKMQTYVDNLNLMYVAFTRAIKNLFIFGPYTENKKGEVKNICELLFSVFENQETSDHENLIIPLNDHWDNENHHFQYGNLIENDDKKEESGPEKITIDEYPEKQLKNRLRLKINGRDYFNPVQESTTGEKINYGIIMHQLFASIKTINDLDNAIQRLVYEGKISGSDENKLKLHIQGLLNSELVKSWFSEDWEVKNEAEILLDSGIISRPDRVLVKNNEAIVIDYKFGDKTDNRYKTQIKGYMNLLSDMGYKHVKGHVWYVNLDRVEDVV